MSGWENVRELVVGSVELPVTPERQKIGWGRRAIQVPPGGKSDQVLAACAYVGPEHSLHLDANLTQPLCAVIPSGESSWERVLEWRVGDDVVMLSEATKSIKIKAPWLDRRLAFTHITK
ncbi:hypothetical protein ACWF0M_10025 [Kribbella sp. NPDC055110]